MFEHLDYANEDDAFYEQLVLGCMAIRGGKDFSFTTKKWGDRTTNSAGEVNAQIPVAGPVLPIADGSAFVAPDPPLGNVSPPGSPKAALMMASAFDGLSDAQAGLPAGPAGAASSSAGSSSSPRAGGASSSKQVSAPRPSVGVVKVGVKEEKKEVVLKGGSKKTVS